MCYHLTNQYNKFEMDMLTYGIYFDKNCIELTNKRTFIYKGNEAIGYNVYYNNKEIKTSSRDFLYIPFKDIESYINGGGIPRNDWKFDFLKTIELWLKDNNYEI